MLEYEYNNIIDYWSKQFKLYVRTKDRKSIVKLYEDHQTQFDDRSLDFSDICQHVLMQSYCENKYPGMHLYENTFSYWARN